MEKDGEISICSPSFVVVRNGPILKRSSGNARMGHL